MRLFVGNLSFQTTELGLQDAFEKFGSVTDCKIMMDRATNRSRGFAFVTIDCPGKFEIIQLVQVPVNLRRQLAHGRQADSCTLVLVVGDPLATLGLTISWRNRGVNGPCTD